MEHIHAFGHVGIFLIAISAVIVALVAHAASRDYARRSEELRAFYERRLEDLRQALNNEIAHFKGKAAGESVNVDTRIRDVAQRLEALAKGAGYEFCPRPHYANPWVVVPSARNVPSSSFGAGQAMGAYGPYGASQFNKQSDCGSCIKPGGTE